MAVSEAASLTPPVDLMVGVEIPVGAVERPACPESTMAKTHPGPAEWDAASAAAVVAEVDRIISREVASGGSADTEARRLLLNNDGLIVRRLQQAQDPLLWAWPEAAWRLMARWRLPDATSSRKN
jgi:hypothetical protein